MSDLYGFSRDTVARFWRVLLFVERNFLRSGQGRNERTRRPPRTYRRFTLTEQLNGGGEAAVTWDDDNSEGTVKAPRHNAWGLPGETGEASPVIGEDGLEWHVTQNPGQPFYLCTADSDITGSGSFSATAFNYSWTPSIPSGGIPDGYYYPQGGYAFVGHSRGTWYVVSLCTCCIEIEP